MNRWVDYFAGDLSEAESDALEAALFDGREDARAAIWMEEAIAAMRRLAGRGTFFPVIDGAAALRIERSGLEVVSVHARDPEFAVDIARPFDVMLTWFHVPLEGVRRLDIEEIGEDGSLVQRFEDAPFTPGSPVVLACESELLASMAATGRTWAELRFIAVDGDQRTTLASFVGRKA